MMMILGMFPFALETTPYESFTRDNSFRHVSSERVGLSPRYQYIGAGEEPITLSGTLYPEISGGDISLEMLRAMAYTGLAWPLVEGTGRIYGMYVITALKQTRAEFFNDGKARKIDFTLSLKKANEDLLESINEYAGDVMNYVAGS